MPKLKLSDPAGTATVNAEDGVAPEQRNGADPTLTHQGESPSRIVTRNDLGPRTTPAKRKRQQRARDAQSTLLFERQDWMLFLSPATLPQKAGCQPEDLRAIVLREIVDNALDAGAHSAIRQDGHADRFVINDDGPGLDPKDVPRLFAVNRPLVSSKLRRMPLRGMLGNGLRVVMGAVVATEGQIAVETRGHRLTLEVDGATGTTKVLEDRAVPVVPGLTVDITLGKGGLPNDGYDDIANLAKVAISLADHGEAYRGDSSPWWYSPRDLHRLMQQVTPTNTTVARLCCDMGFTLDDQRIARTLTREDAAAVLDQLRARKKPVPSTQLGMIGPDAYDRCYARHTGIAAQHGADIPFVVEAWTICQRSEKRGSGTVQLTLLLNRTPSVADIMAHSYPEVLSIRGCGLNRYVGGPRTADYRVVLSVIAPYIELATDGKAPALAPFSEAIATVLRKACGAAYRAMDKPPGKISIKDAAWQVMPEAYRIASGGGTLPANARQIMYAARPAILRLTARGKIDDKYFTQTLLPDYVEEHPIATRDWDVVFDARGHFVEPHTGRAVDLGTLAVRQYLGERPTPEGPARLDPGLMVTTSGPQHRYGSVLFVEKEGFGPLLAHAQIAERFDMSIMSTKGMSVTAARLLLDRLAPQIDKILVLHDFDVSGFSNFGTLGSDGRRYQFENQIDLVDIGLRLTDIEELGLEFEPVETSGDWEKRAGTLEEHGATTEEIELLRHNRVELNAMPSNVFIEFLERKLTEHSVGKVMPPNDVMQAHARSVIARALTNRALETVRAKAEVDAAAIELPVDLRDQVIASFDRHPAVPWDLAVATIALGLCGDGEA